MLDIFQKISDLITPPHPTIKILRAEKPENFSRLFSPQRINGTIVLSDYTNPIIKAAITANKFHNYDKASLLLAKLLERWLETLPEKPTIFIPVPLSSKRLHERGYNQVAKVLTHIKGENREVIQMLVRTKNTKPQTELTREKRFDNVKDAFSFINYPDVSSEARLVLVDDVVTTGATIYSAKETLQTNISPETEVITLALAH